MLDDLTIRRAKGGHKIHLLKRSSGNRTRAAIAMCGHAPRDSVRNCFAYGRAGWSSQLMSLGRAPCEACRKQAIKEFPSSQEVAYIDTLLQEQSPPF